MFLKNKKNLYVLIVFLSFCGSIIYFRDYISAIINGFSNYLINCGDFGQYSYEGKKFFQNHHLYSFITPDREPGYFLSALILGKTLGLSSDVSLFVIDFIVRLISLFFIGFIGKKIGKKYIFGILAIIFAITIFQTSYVYLQLISRQLFSTSLLLGASFIYFVCPKKIITLSILLSMSFISHRFGGIIAIIAILIGGTLSTVKNKKIDFSYLKTFVFLLIFSFPFIYFLVTYNLYSSLGASDPFLYNTSLNHNLGGFNGGFSYLGNSGLVKSTPLFHYYKYQGFYLLLIIPFIWRILKNTQGLFINIVFTLILYSLLKIVFSIRSLISFEIFLLPLFAYSFKFFGSRILKVTVIFCFIILGLTGLNGRMPIKMTKVFAKDSSTIFIENNFNKKNAVFLASNRCDSDLISQLNLATGSNMENDTLENIKEPKNEILSYVLAQINLEKNFNRLILGGNELYDFLKGKEIYLFFGQSSDRLDLTKLSNRTHKIYEVPFLKLVYEEPKSKYIKYIFEMDTKNTTYFDNGYYLRDVLKDIPK